MAAPTKQIDFSKSNRLKILTPSIEFPNAFYPKKKIECLNLFFLQENHSRVQNYTFKELLEGQPANVLG